MSIRPFQVTRQVQKLACARLLQTLGTTVQQREQNDRLA